MTGLVRNRLVWIADAAWQDVMATLPDEQAREIVRHWCRHGLPLVVTSQPRGIAAGRVAVGLPAPRLWSRRRLAFDVALDAVCRHGGFPTLRQAALHYRWPEAAAALDRSLAGLGTSAHVYGSHGWQLLTGRQYLHGASDLDLCIGVPDFDTACAVVPCLDGAGLHCPVDGELVFNEGSAVPWREFGQMLERHTVHLLVKRLDGPRLVTAEVLRRDTATAAGDHGAATATAAS